jgi:hypothetical protein
MMPHPDAYLPDGRWALTRRTGWGGEAPDHAAVAIGQVDSEGVLGDMHGDYMAGIYRDRTRPLSSALPNLAVFGSSGAVARRRVRRSPRRALALGRPRPARPRRTSRAAPMMYRLIQPRRPVQRHTVILGSDCPARGSRVNAAYRRR